MYPFNSEESLQLNTFIAWRQIAFFAMTVTGGFFVWLLYQLVYDGNPPNVKQTLVLMVLVALMILTVYFALNSVKPDHLYQQHGTKAGFEKVLYHLIRHIEADTNLSPEQKDALYKQYLEDLRDTAGHERHLANIPIGPLKNRLMSTIDQMRHEEGQRLVRHMTDSGGYPASHNVLQSGNYCSCLENMRDALSPTPRVT